MRRILPYLVGIILLASCGELGPMGHHKPNHAGGGDDACPPGHERQGLCATEPEEPEPDPVVSLDSIRFSPGELTTKVGESVGFHVVFFALDAPHFCAVVDGEVGLLEVRPETDGWVWADDPAWHPYGCDALEVSVKDPDIAEVEWSPHVLEDWSAVGGGYIRESGWWSA